MIDRGYMSKVKHKYITTENTYVNAYTKGDKIYVIEKDKNNKRVIKEDNLDFIFYALDDYGKHKTIFGENCTKYEYNTRAEFFSAMKLHPKEKIYENDMNHTFRYLSKNYDFDSTPNLNVAIYDIEVEFRDDTRYSDADKAENSIISYAVQHQWSGHKYCVVLPPPNKTIKETEEIARKVQVKYNGTADIIVCKTEAELLNLFFILIEDADVITGWNSQSYDFKYLVNRITKVLGEQAVRKLSPLNELPIERTAFNENIKAYYTVLEPVGLVHLDYQLLYKKYTYSELTSFSLDNVSYVELDDQKVEYDGSLYDLYLEDLGTFIEYNIKDCELVDRLDEKLKFIDLTNLLAHSNGVLMQTTMGTVALSDQAIINEGHYYFDDPVVFPSKPKRDENASGAAGAFVVEPKVGVRREVSGIDLASLYPSVIRALNMSPETLIAHINSDKTDNHVINAVSSGMVKTFAEAWHPFFNTMEFEEVRNQTDVEVILEFNRNGQVTKTTGKEVYNLVHNNPHLCISANGTIFSTEKIGVIPSLLTRWFAERRQLQAQKAIWKDKLDTVSNDKEKNECVFWITFYDQRQMAKKINLNALYGALLNQHCRFYDKRIGQSTTLTGRSISRHMGSQTNLIICGEYTHEGDAIVYGDTDSVYFSVFEAMKARGQGYTLSKEESITMYDEIADAVNKTFPKFMNTTFHITEEQGKIISAERENLADYSLFIKKKRYVMRIYDDDGRRVDTNGKKGKMKYMGVEIKRSDTPKIIQDILSEGLDVLLDGKTEKEVMDVFVKFKEEILDIHPWLLGRPSGANAVTYYSDLYKEYMTGKSKKKPRLPGAIAGVIYYNQLLDLHGEEKLPRIGDASKVINCKLLKNSSGFNSISYPTDMVHFPEWFKKLPFDMDSTIDSIFIKKVENIFGVVGFHIDLLKANANFHNNFEEDEF